MQCPKCDQDLHDEDITQVHLGIDCRSCNRMRITHIITMLSTGAAWEFPPKLFDRAIDKYS